MGRILRYGAGWGAAERDLQVPAELLGAAGEEPVERSF